MERIQSSWKSGFLDFVFCPEVHPGVPVPSVAAWAGILWLSSHISAFSWMLNYSDFAGDCKAFFLFISRGLIPITNFEFLLQFIWYLLGHWTNCEFHKIQTTLNSVEILIVLMGLFHQKWWIWLIVRNSLGHQRLPGQWFLEGLDHKHNVSIPAS